MQLQISQEDEYVLGSISGLIDEEAGDLFRRQLYPLVAQRGAKMILDLSKARRINSAGLGHLVILASRANANASRVVLANCSPFLSVILQQSKLDKFFDVAESLPEAVDRLSGQ